MDEVLNDISMKNTSDQENDQKHTEEVNIIDKKEDKRNIKS